MERRQHAVRGLLIVTLLGLGDTLVGCGTGAAPAGGDRDLPNAQVGPFRVLREGETSRKAPFIFEVGLWRDPDVVDLGSVPGTLARMYMTGGGGNNAFIASVELTNAIARPDTVPARVLAASEAWEQGALAAPSLLHEDGRFVMYYAAGGCIGRAVSTDGLAFTREPATPVFCDAAGPISSPNVVRTADGSFRMLHDFGGAIVESRSVDGLAWVRGEPILAPSGVAEAYDETAVGDAFALWLTSAKGRAIRYVYYTGTASTGLRSIGLAARFGDEGPLERAREPVLSRYEPRSPCALVFGDQTLLYASSRRAEVGNDAPAILAGLAPATLERPLPKVVRPTGGAGGADSGEE